jgi:hypothetical protein
MPDKLDSVVMTKVSRSSADAPEITTLFLAHYFGVLSVDHTLESSDLQQVRDRARRLIRDPASHWQMSVFVEGVVLIHVTIDLRNELTISELESANRAPLKRLAVYQILFPHRAQGRTVVTEYRVQGGPQGTARTVVQLDAAEASTQSDVGLGG